MCEITNANEEQKQKFRNKMQFNNLNNNNKNILQRSSCDLHVL